MEPDLLFGQAIKHIMSFNNRRLETDMYTLISTCCSAHLSSVASDFRGLCCHQAWYGIASSNPT
jgi:hypothetical protein